MDIAGYEPDTARMILETIRYLRANPYVLQGTIGGAPQLTGTPVYVKSVYSGEIPPYACMEATGTVEEDGQNYLEVDRPSGDDGVFLFNNHDTIEVGGYGVGSNAPITRGLSSESPGTSVSPAKDSWALEVGTKGRYTIIGPDDLASDCQRVAAGGEDIASFIKVQYSGSIWNLVDYYNGFDPGLYFTDVGDIIDDPLNGCWKDGDFALAWFDGNDDKYLLSTSQSGVQGNVEEKDVVISASQESGELVFEKIRLAASCVSFATPDTIPLESCDGEEPAPCDEGSCTYTWNVWDEEWVITDPCPDGCTCLGPPLGDGDNHGDTRTLGCSGG